MQNIFTISKLGRTSVLFLLPIFVLSVIGAANVFSTTYFIEKSISATFVNQSLYYVISFALFFFITIVKISFIKNKYLLWIVYFLTIALLVSVLFIGREVGETKRWLDIGPISIQPSEIAKVSVIVLVARILHMDYKRIDVLSKGGLSRVFLRLKKHEILTKVAMLSVLYCSFGLLIYLERSLGNFLLFSGIFFGTILLSLPVHKYFWGYALIGIVSLFVSFGFIDIQAIPYSFELYTTSFFVGSLLVLFVVWFIFTRGLRLKLWISTLIALCFLLAQPFLLFGYDNLLRPYQRERIETFLNPSNAGELEEDYQRQQALRAIGSAGLRGKGFLDSQFANTSLLPLAESDFALGSYVEQFGFVGFLFLVGLFVFLLSQIIFIADKTTDAFSRSILYGVFFLILLNTFQHIGMNLGKLPITGVPLPFISAGGSSLLSLFVAMGLVSSIAASTYFRPMVITDESR